MDTRKENHPGRRLLTAAAGPRGTRRTSGAIRTCIPARSGQSGYREPAEADDSDAHIVRGED